MTELERFMAKVDRPVTSGACWPWQASKDLKGYGRFWFRGKLVPSHRASFIMFNGAIPAGLHVLHRCDNPACVNPDHLFTGSNAVNMADMVSKGRSGCQKGTSNSKSKLTEAQVLEIRRLASEGMTHTKLGPLFGVARAHIGLIINRKAWAHI